MQDDRLDITRPYNTAFWQQRASYHTQNGRKYHLDGSPFSYPDPAAEQGSADEPAPTVDPAAELPPDVEEHAELVPAVEGAAATDATDQLLVARSGEPFRSEAVAEAVMAKKSMDPGLYKVVPHLNGYAITPKVQE